jgi:DNA helicase II / ATP-dependent DNA helicase PcrA
MNTLSEDSRPETFPNSQQQEVIRRVGESLLVLAPMGTGKTRTAAAAISRAIESGIAPERILGITFTNRAAEAMRVAVGKVIPQSSAKIPLMNLHGFCARLLREEHALAHLTPDFGILDEEDSMELLWQFISQSDKSARYQNKPQNALNDYEKYVFGYLLGGQPGLKTPIEYVMYRDALRRDGTVDFTGLIARTHRLLGHNAHVREKWQRACQWILVDEVQDINLAEYQILSLMAGGCRCLKFFGDPHQTIFEWRFAQPQQVLDAFQREFTPVVLSLTANYRCSPGIVQLSNTVRKHFIPSNHPFPEPFLNDEGSVAYVEAQHAGEELDFLGRQVTEWMEQGIQPERIAVLARTNLVLKEISTRLTAINVPHLQADDFDFFRRKEIKEVLALLEHSISPFRRQPVLRTLKLFGARIASLEKFESQAAGTGLHISQLVREPLRGDPLHALLEAWRLGNIAAVDTETTGLDPAKAEVVQFAYVGRERIVSEYLRPSHPVGKSVETHGLTDEFLSSHGREPAEVLDEIAKILEGRDVWLGHNLQYDLEVLKSQFLRSGRTFSSPKCFDTMPLAAALLKREELPGLRLEHVSKAFGVELKDAHDAVADSQACLDVLGKMIPTLENRQAHRMRAVEEIEPDLNLAIRKTLGIYQAVEALRDTLPFGGELVLKTWEILKSTPGEHDFRSHPAREKNVQQLARVADHLREQKGALSIHAFLELVTLSRKEMLFESDPHRVRLLTAHSAKGLEFDAVALPRLVAPWKDSEEEARVFYVMITRARRHLWLCCPRRAPDRRGELVPVQPLRFLSVFEQPSHQALPPKVT